MSSFYDRPVPRAPQVRGVSDAYRAVETAIQSAKVAHPTLRYGFVLRQLPDWVLDGLMNTFGEDGDNVSAKAVCVYLTFRVGGMLHRARNPIAVAAQKQPDDPKSAEDEVLNRVGPRVFLDCAREKMRRLGWIEFSPAPDPFVDGAAGRVPKKIEMTELGAALEGEEKVTLELALSDAGLNAGEISSTN